MSLFGGFPTWLLYIIGFCVGVFVCFFNLRLFFFLGGVQAGGWVGCSLSPLVYWCIDYIWPFVSSYMKYTHPQQAGRGGLVFSVVSMLVTRASIGQHFGNGFEIWMQNSQTLPCNIFHTNDNKFSSVCCLLNSQWICSHIKHVLWLWKGCEMEKDIWFY